VVWLDSHTTNRRHSGAPLPLPPPPPEPVALKGEGTRKTVNHGGKIVFRGHHIYELIRLGEEKGVIHDRYSSRGNGDSSALAGPGSPGVPKVKVAWGGRSPGAANARLTSSVIHLREQRRPGVVHEG